MWKWYFHCHFQTNSFVSCSCNWTITKYLSTWKHNYLWPNQRAQKKKETKRENGQHKRRNFVNWKRRRWETDAAVADVYYRYKYMFSRYALRIFRRLVQNSNLVSFIWFLLFVISCCRVFPERARELHSTAPRTKSPTTGGTIGL